MAAHENTRLFHLGDVLSITTRMLVSPRYMYGVYDLIQYLNGSEPPIDALDDDLTKCRALLLAQYPMLADVETAGVEFGTWETWLKQQTAAHGEFLYIQRQPPD